MGDAPHRSSAPVWLDGAVRDADAATVSVFDHGLTVGDGVFETVLVVDGAPFALTRHLARLDLSARALRLPPPDLTVVRRAAAELLAATDSSGALRLRITYTGGRSPLGSDRGDGPATLVLATAQLARRAASSAVATVPWTRNERGALAGLKTTSYADNVLALAYARDRGADEAIFENTIGELCEGTGSNVVIALEGRLVTPPLASGCLAGVTRALVLEWCDVVEAPIPVAALRSADEVLLTSSTRHIHPVHAVDGRALEAPGPLTAAAMAAYEERASETNDP